MDTNIAGLNKVYCFVNNSTYNGKAVTISDGTNTWTQTISSLSCVFMIPSMPAPAKKRYTVRLYNAATATGSTVYSTTIDLGFGDSIRVGLYENAEVVTKGSIPIATSSRIGGFKTNDTSTNGIYMDGDYLKLRTASSSQKGGVKIPSGSGLYMSGDNLYLSAAGSSSSNKGGVYVNGYGLLLDSDGQIKVNPGTGLEISNNKVGVKDFVLDSKYFRLSEEKTIRAKTSEFISCYLESETEKQRIMKKGFPIYAHCGQGDVFTFVTGVAIYQGTYGRIDFSLYNTATSDRDINSITLEYQYFS